MRCDDCREAISAGLDGEELPGESAAVDAHLQGCAECRSYAARAAHVTRLTRMRPAEDAPDLVAAVLAAAAARRPTGALRLALGGVGVGQCALAVSGIASAGADHSRETAGVSAAHLVNESSAWSLALAVGFLLVAVGGPRISGLVPVVAAFVGVLTVLSAFDLLGGRVDAARLLSHGLVVAGLVLLVVLQRTAGDDGGGTDATNPLASPAGRAEAPGGADRGLPRRGGPEGLRARAARRAA